MVRAAPRWPTCTKWGWCSISVAMRRISPGSVAEKSSVWRSGGSADRMRCTSGQKPMSIMRSASSRTSTCTRRRSTASCRMWSIRRPGVATTMSTPALSARSCGPISTPPNTGGGRHRGMVGETHQGVFDLHRQLAGRRQDERARERFARRVVIVRLLGEQPLQDGGGKGQRLAGAGLGAGHDVVSRERERNHRALHRPRDRRSRDPPGRSRGACRSQATRRPRLGIGVDEQPGQPGRRRRRGRRNARAPALPRTMSGRAPAARAT